MCVRVDIPQERKEKDLAEGHQGQRRCSFPAFNNQNSYR